MTARLEQGLVLDDRYQLDEWVGEFGSAAQWKGTDTILARAVSVLALPSSAAETPRVLTAARRAARIRDSRIVQVFDTATFEDITYVITEWVTGRTLREMLAESGPLHPDRAGALVGEAAEALAEAHRMAVSHLSLGPDNLVWTAAGGVKVTGVGVEAALAGTVSEDPARADAEGLGALLYAALTARWPYGDNGDLPAAPVGSDGRPVSPRQVRAGVPPELDATTDRALSQRSRRGHPPLAAPAEVAEALADFPDPAPLDFFAEAGQETSGAATDRLPMVTAPASYGAPYASDHGGRRNRRRALVAVPAGVALVGVLAFGGLRLGLSGLSLGGSSSSPSAGSSSSTGHQTPAGKKQYPIVAVHDFDPQGDGHEHSENVDRVKDGTARTVWYTDRYNSDQFGNLKSGVGVVVDLGSPKAVDSVQLRLAGEGGDLQLRASDSAGTSLDDFDTVAKQQNAGERVTLRPANQAKARYWLVWFTKLPSGDGGYRAGIGDITFRPAG